MDGLELSHKYLLAESTLYADFMKHRFLDRFERLKKDRSDHSARRRDAAELLAQVQVSFEGVWPTVEAEVQLCMVMTGSLSEEDKWLYLLEKPERTHWLREWFDVDPRFALILPWFDSQHSWKSMPWDSYLAGARIVREQERLVPKILNPVARSIIQDWHRLLASVQDTDGKEFVELMHVDLAVLKLGVTAPDRPIAPTVPASFSVETARKLWTKSGPHFRRTWPPSTTFASLQGMLAKATAEAEAEATARPALPGGDSMPSSASAGDIVPPDAVAAGAALECKLKLGDEVITKSGKQKASYDGKRGVVTKVLSSRRRVNLLTGPCAGQEKDFAFKMVSMAPSTVGAALSATAKRPAPADPVSEPVPKKPEHDAGLAEAIFGPLGDL